MEMDGVVMWREKSAGAPLFQLFMAHDNDPRDSSLESPFTLPQSWGAQDNLGSCLF